MRSFFNRLGAAAIALGLGLSFPFPALPQAIRIEQILRESQNLDSIALVSLLRKAEILAREVESWKQRAWFYVRIADRYRDMGDYEAERLYLLAVDNAPDDPAVLEATARYYRLYRGSKGLFALSEKYYLRAEEAVEEKLREARADPRSLPQETQDLITLRELILRGRVELLKREGLGAVIPDRPGEEEGIYFSSALDLGQFPFLHNDLATPYLKINRDHPGLRSESMLRHRRRFLARERVRFRNGAAPYLDLAITGSEVTRALDDYKEPQLHFKDVRTEDWELGVENVHGLAPLGDVFWRIEAHHGQFDPDGMGDDESSDRFNALATATRSFGRSRFDLEWVGSYAAIERSYGTEDNERLGGATLRYTYYPELSNFDLKIDPRAYEFFAGVVRSKTDFGTRVAITDDTFFASAKFTELWDGTDLQILPNLRRKNVSGKVDPDEEDSEDLETNLILVHRLIDNVNSFDPPLADRNLALAQWAVTCRGFLDLSTRSLDDFESCGVELGSFVEVFSGPMNRTTAILEAYYELRDYFHLDRLTSYFRMGLKIGF
jgi:hypothetical protein